MEKQKNVIVIGHRNPDNDAICAAVGYAYLKHKLDPSTNYVAGRQGPLPDETKWILERMGIASPRYVPHAFSRVCDAMSTDVIKCRHDDILLNAGRKMREHNIRALVVTDDEGKYKGIVTMRRLSEIYIDDIDMVDSYESKLRLGDIALACGGRIVVGNPDRVLNGHLRVAAAEPETFRLLISPGDTVVMGDRVRSQRIAVESKVGCMIMAVGAEPDEEIVELARQNDVAIICAEQDTYTVTRMATLSQSIDDYIETDAALLDSEALLSEIVPDLLRSHQREGIVLDDYGYCIGIITRTDVAKLPRRQLILVDHNERAQSLPGVSEADVLEIIDHHRVGDIQTSGPIKFLLLPWGSSSTIVADQFRANHVDMPSSIAGVLLSAILTDTVLLKSPTTTDIDREIAQWLGGILEVDPIEFGIELYHRRGDEGQLPVNTMVTSDSKEFVIDDKRVLIAQHETADMQAAMQRADEIQEYVCELQTNSGYDIVLFMLTDIINVGSQFFAAGNTRMVERVFGISLQNGSVWVSDVISRKKQVVASLMNR